MTMTLHSVYPDTAPAALPVRPIDNLGITGLFTVVSVIRSYVWRRIFNRIHKVKT